MAFLMLQTFIFDDKSLQMHICIVREKKWINNNWNGTNVWRGCEGRGKMRKINKISIQLMIYMLTFFFLLLLFPVANKRINFHTEYRRLHPLPRAWVSFVYRKIYKFLNGIVAWDGNIIFMFPSLPCLKT